MATHSETSRSPAASPRRPSAPGAGDAARASGGHSTAFQDQITLTQGGRLRLPGASPHTRHSPEGEGRPREAAPSGFRIRIGSRLRLLLASLLPFVAFTLQVRLAIGEGRARLWEAARDTERG